jgi:hypothetical protein
MRAASTQRRRTLDKGTRALRTQASQTPELRTRALRTQGTKTREFQTLVKMTEVIMIGTEVITTTPARRTPDTKTLGTLTKTAG